MTPAQITLRHVDLWLAEDPSLPEAHTLTQRMTDAISEALAVQAEEHRNATLTLQHESGVLAAVKAACNFDISGDASPETTVRRLWHENQEMKFARERTKQLEGELEDKG